MEAVEFRPPVGMQVNPVRIAAQVLLGEGLQQHRIALGQRALASTAPATYWLAACAIAGTGRNYGNFPNYAPSITEGSAARSIAAQALVSNAAEAVVAEGMEPSILKPQ